MPGLAAPHVEFATAEHVASGKGTMARVSQPTAVRDLAKVSSARMADQPTMGDGRPMMAEAGNRVVLLGPVRHRLAMRDAHHPVHQRLTDVREAFCAMLGALDRQGVREIPPPRGDAGGAARFDHHHRRLTRGLALVPVAATRALAVPSHGSPGVIHPFAMAPDQAGMAAVTEPTGVTPLVPPRMPVVAMVPMVPSMMPPRVPISVPVMVAMLADFAIAGCGIGESARLRRDRASNENDENCEDPVHGAPTDVLVGLTIPKDRSRVAASTAGCRCG